MDLILKDFWGSCTGGKVFEHERNETFSIEEVIIDDRQRPADNNMDDWMKQLK